MSKAEFRETMLTFKPKNETRFDPDNVLAPPRDFAAPDPRVVRSDSLTCNSFLSPWTPAEPVRTERSRPVADTFDWRKHGAIRFPKNPCYNELLADATIDPSCRSIPDIGQ